MTTIAGDISGYRVLSPKRERMLINIRTTIGAAGAVSATDADDPACTCTKNGGTGDYTFGFPNALKGSAFVSMVSAAGTVKTHWQVAFSPTAGTLNIVTGNGGGTATNPASGDVLHVLLVLDTAG